MKIGIDIDGTLTNFEQFLLDNSQEYMRKNYGLEITNPDGYDLDQMYELEKVYMNKGLSQEEASLQSKKILDKYWQKNFHKYLMNGFREGAKEVIKRLYYNEHEIIIFSSRKKTTENSVLGKVVRNSTLATLKLNGIKTDEVHFFENDEDKITEMKKRRLDVVFEDKPELIEELSKTTNVVCVNSSYNTEVESHKNIHKIDNYDEEEIVEIVNSILEKKGGKPISPNDKITIYNKAIKLVSKHENSYKANDISYSLVRTFGGFFLLKKFKPIILNPEKANVEGPSIISPNHRTTIDPFFVLSTTKHTTHWVALKRFFDAEDSIANNRKAPILRYLTAIFFRITGAIPIERTSDNPKANNRESIQRMRALIKDNRHIGIFPEGTTNKNVENERIYESDRKGTLSFILLREQVGATILPVSIKWIKDKEKIGNRLIINYRDPFTAEDVEKFNENGEQSFVDAAYDLWKEKVVEGLIENEELENELEKEYDSKALKGRQKVYRSR